MNESSPADELLYKLALSFLPDVGDRRARALVAYCGSPEAVFREKKRLLENIPGIGSSIALSIRDGEALACAEREMKFIRRYKIKALSYLDEEYPARLRECEDGPVMLYLKGKVSLDASRIIAFVGSRKATEYGRKNCEELVDGLKELNPLVVSGMAYGIDVCAHRRALKNRMPTVGVLAHGLDTIYPSSHRNVAEKMLEDGGLVTEFPSGTSLHPDLFPRRNRIIAGMSDAVVVVEASMRSGSLVTAGLANDYNRDVFAVPGNLGLPSSEGCNFLIKTHKAALVQSSKDIEYIMGWDNKDKSPSVQASLFAELSPEEEKVVSQMRGKESAHVDEIAACAGMPVSRTLSLLLQLEFAGLVRSIPGKMFQLRGEM